MTADACESCGCNPNDPWYCAYCTDEDCPCGEARAAADDDPED
jgi:hypothetical protein